MSSPVKPRRAYNSPLRAERARATRQRILDSASRLFVDRGYPATTIEAVAHDAGVAADTIYHLFTTKRGLLKEVMDVVIAGDEDTPVLEQSGPQQVRVERDQRRQVELAARGTAARLERVRPLDDILRSAACVDPEVAALRDDIQSRQRRTAMRTLAGWIASNGPLRDNMPRKRAGDILWVLTSPDVHRLYRDECGWSADQYAAWLAQAVLDALIARDDE